VAGAGRGSVDHPDGAVHPGNCHGRGRDAGGPARVGAPGGNCVPPSGKGDAGAGTRRQTQSSQTRQREEGSPQAGPGQRVNINKASQEELEKIPGIGPAKAKAIIKGRPYKNPQDIMKVKGIKKGIYNKIKDFISVQ
jgi:competence ComEA-like helix-hairpin-helix protein